MDGVQIVEDARHVPTLAQQFDSMSRSVASLGVRSVEPRGGGLDDCMSLH